jgi:NAD-dependent DNA ligase
MSNIIKKLNKSNDTITSINELTINELEEVITFSADKYYNTDTPVISDSIYDMLIDFLQSKNPKSKVLKAIGASVKGKNKVKLDYWLGSMDKIKPPSNQLDIWLSKYNKPYYFADKLDGISALVIYKNNEEIKMYTRGTSNEGLDISSLIKYINIPEWSKVNTYCKKNKLVSSNKDNIIAFRGELVLEEKLFESNWASTFKNPRNTVSGLVNSKKINPQLANDISIVLYEVVDPFLNIENQYKIINDLDFICVHYKVINKEIDYELLSTYFKKRREKSIYQIDGIIVTNNNEHVRNKSGNPKYAFAFKDILDDQKATTKVINIEWNISKDGYIIPTILLEPVTVSGVEIKRVTGNNARNVVDNNIGKGATVEIIRSGDVIPKINKIIKPGKVILPEGKWSWSSTNVDIILDNMNNMDIMKKNVYFFFSTLDTKGLGEKVIDKLYTAGFNTVEKILASNETELKNAHIEGFKEKTISNIIKSIKVSTTDVTLPLVMTASNKLGHGLGIERMKQIVINIPNILDNYKKWSKTEFIDLIKEIPGWDTKTATLFVSNFNDFIEFYNLIKKYIKIKNISNSKGKLMDKIFVFSGFRDKDLQNEIESQGGKVGTSISTNTHYLVVKDEDTLANKTGKIIKAEELGIKIITKDKLYKKLE